MDFDNCDRPAPGKKLSEQFVEFIDLTDEDLKEIDVLEFGGVHGGRKLGRLDACKSSYCSSCSDSYSDYGDDYGDDSGY